MAFYFILICHCTTISPKDFFVPKSFNISMVGLMIKLNYWELPVDMSIVVGKNAPG